MTTTSISYSLPAYYPAGTIVRNGLNNFVYSSSFGTVNVTQPEPPKKPKTIGLLFYSKNNAKEETAIKIKSFEQTIDFLGFRMWVMTLDEKLKELDFCLTIQSPMKEIQRLKAVLAKQTSEMTLNEIRVFLDEIEELEDEDIYNDWKTEHTIVDRLKIDDTANTFYVSYDDIKLRFELKKPKKEVMEESKVAP